MTKASAPLCATAVSRTATDALQAKYSAILLADYPALFPTTSWKPERQPNDRATRDSSYRNLLGRLTELLQSQNVSCRRRQTPLVNVGYAVRVASVLHHVDRFVSFHDSFATATTAHSSVQIVILGAGWDVTGLWCDPSMLLDTTTTTAASPPNQQRLRRHVIEIDVPFVAQEKARAIRQLDVLRSEVQTPVPSNEKQDIVYQGSSSNEMFRLTLVGADLEDIDTVQRIWTNLIQPDVPTLVVCELVLAYLQPSACDALLRLCAQKLGGLDSGHCLLMYEPLGPNVPNDEENEMTVHRSVLESFQHSYSAQFNAKLTRGRIGGDNGNQPRRVSYYSPLARSVTAVRDRLLRLGWYGHVHAATAGTIASRLGYGHGNWHPGGCSGTRELFDEHAALALHLSSYSLVCAFGDRSRCAAVVEDEVTSHNTVTSVVDTDLLRGYMCGDWTQTRGLLLSPVCFRMTTTASNSSIWITGIASQDESQVRSLFSQSYGLWSESYSSIRKMVKSALRTDLGVADERGTDRSTVDNEERSSTIGKHYWDMAGDFVIAVQVASHGNETAEERDSFQEESDVPRRRVLGAIGIRQWTEKECTSRRIPSAHEDAPPPGSLTFEVQRFFVDTEFRGQGIGSALLTALLNSLRIRLYRPWHRDVTAFCQPRPEIRVIATTPTILEAANRLYASHQFTVESDVPTGELTLRTYTVPLWIDSADEK